MTEEIKSFKEITAEHKKERQRYCRNTFKKDTLLDNFFQMKPPRPRLDNLANWFPYGATGHIE